MLDDIATYLAAQSTSLAVLSGSTGNLVKTIWPADSPNELVGLFEQPGSATVFEFSTSTGPATALYTAPSLQVLSRSTSAVTAKANADAAFDLLDGFYGSLPTSTGTYYVQIVADQPPFQAARDANQRFVYSVNFTVWKGQ